MSMLTTLEEAKAYLGIKAAESDALLAALIGRASAAIENYCQRSLLAAPRIEYRDGTGAAALLLREYPVRSVESVTVDGREIPAAAWHVAGRLLVLEGYSFTPGRANVTISYTAGLDAVPPDVVQACNEMVALMYRRRDHIDTSSKSLAGETVAYITAEMPPSARQILNNYRVVAPF